MDPSASHQVQTHPILQCTLRWLLLISASLVKTIDHNAIHQVSLFSPFAK
jgi:hypothetical protein